MPMLPQFIYSDKIYTDVLPQAGTYLSAYLNAADKTANKKSLFFCDPEGNSWDLCSNVNGDWNQEDSSLPDFINNKPEIVKGLADGSIRGTNTDEESSSYHLGENAVALGKSTNASGDASFVTGYGSKAEGNYSTASGYQSYAMEDFSQADGYSTSAGGAASHTEGAYTIANNMVEHAQGQYNISNTDGSKVFNGSGDNTLFSIGNGTASPGLEPVNSKNAVEVMQNGDMYVQGIGGYNGKNYSEASTLQQAIQNAGNGDLIYIDTASESTLEDGTITNPFHSLTNAINYFNTLDAVTASKKMITGVGNSTDNPENFRIDEGIINYTQLVNPVTFYVPKNSFYDLGQWSAGETIVSNNSVKIVGDGGFKCTGGLGLSNNFSLYVDVNESIYINCPIVTGADTYHLTDFNENITLYTNGDINLTAPIIASTTYYDIKDTLNVDIRCKSIFSSTSLIYSTPYQELLNLIINCDNIYMQDAELVSTSSGIDTNISINVKNIFSCSKLFYGNTYRYGNGTLKANIHAGELRLNNAMIYISNAPNDVMSSIDINLNIDNNFISYENSTSARLFDMHSCSNAKFNINVGGSIDFGDKDSSQFMNLMAPSLKSDTDWNPIKVVINCKNDIKIIGNLVSFSSESRENVYDIDITAGNNIELCASEYYGGQMVSGHGKLVFKSKNFIFGNKNRSEGYNLAGTNSVQHTLTDDDKFTSYCPSITIKADNDVIISNSASTTLLLSIISDRLIINSDRCSYWNSSEFLINVNTLDLSNYIDLESPGGLFECHEWMYYSLYARKRNMTRADFNPSIFNIKRVIFPNTDLGSIVRSNMSLSYSKIDNPDQMIYVGARAIFHVNELDYGNAHSLTGVLNSRFANIVGTIPGTYIAGVIEHINIYQPDSDGLTDTIYPWDKFLSSSVFNNSIENAYWITDTYECNRPVSQVIFLEYNQAIPTIYIDAYGGNDSNLGTVESSPFRTPDYAIFYACKYRIPAVKFKILTDNENSILSSSHDYAYGNNDIKINFDFTQWRGRFNYHPQFMWFEGNGFCSMNLTGLHTSSTSMVDFKDFANVNYRYTGQPIYMFYAKNVLEFTTLDYDSGTNKYYTSFIDSAVVELDTSNDKSYVGGTILPAEYSQSGKDECSLQIAAYNCVLNFRGSQSVCMKNGVFSPDGGTYNIKGNNGVYIKCERNYTLTDINAKFIELDYVERTNSTGTSNYYWGSLRAYAVENVIVYGDIYGTTLLKGSSCMLNGRYAYGNLDMEGAVHSILCLKNVDLTDTRESSSIYSGGTVYMKAPNVLIDSRNDRGSGKTCQIGGYCRITVDCQSFKLRNIDIIDNSGLYINCEDCDFSQTSTLWKGYYQCVVNAKAKVNFASSQCFGEYNEPLDNWHGYINIDARNSTSYNYGNPNWPYINNTYSSYYQEIKYFNSSISFNSFSMNWNANINHALIDFNFSDIDITTDIYNTKGNIKAKKLYMRAGYTDCQFNIDADEMTIGGGWNKTGNAGSSTLSPIYNIHTRKLIGSSGGLAGEFYIDGDDIQFESAPVFMRDTKLFMNARKLRLGNSSWISDTRDVYINSDICDLWTHINVGCNGGSFDETLHKFEFHCKKITTSMSSFAPLFYIYAADKQPYDSNRGGNQFSKILFNIERFDLPKNSASLSMSAPLFYIGNYYYGCPIEVHTNDNQFASQLKWNEYYANQYSVDLRVTPEYGEFERGERIVRFYSDGVTINTSTGGYVTDGKYVKLYQYLKDDGTTATDAYNKFEVGKYYIVHVFGRKFGPMICKSGQISAVSCKYLGDGSFTPDGYANQNFIPKDYDLSKDEEGFQVTVSNGAWPGYTCTCRVDKLRVYQQDGYFDNWESKSGSECFEVSIYDLGYKSNNIISEYEVDKIPAKYLYQPDLHQTDKNAPDYIKNITRAYFGHGYPIDGWYGYASAFGNALSSGKHCKRFQHISNNDNGLLGETGGIKFDIKNGDKFLVVIDGIPYVRNCYGGLSYGNYKYSIGNDSSSRFWGNNNYDVTTDDWCIYITQNSTSNKYDVEWAFTTKTTDRAEKVYHDVKLFKILDEIEDATEISTNEFCREIWIDTKFAKEVHPNVIYLSIESQGLDIVNPTEGIWSDANDGLTKDSPVATLRRACQLANRYDDCHVEVIKCLEDTSSTNVYLKHDEYLLQEEDIKLKLEDNQYFHTSDILADKYSTLISHDIIIRGGTPYLTLENGVNFYIAQGAKIDFKTDKCIYIDSIGVPSSGQMFWDLNTDSAPTRTVTGNESIKLESGSEMYLDGPFFNGGSFKTGSNKNTLLSLYIKSNCLYFYFNENSQDSYLKNLIIDTNCLGYVANNNCAINAGFFDIKIGTWYLNNNLTFKHKFMNTGYENWYTLPASKISVDRLIMAGAESSAYTDAENQTWSVKPIVSFENSDPYSLSTSSVTQNIDLYIKNYDLRNIGLNDFDNHKYSPIYYSESDTVQNTFTGIVDNVLLPEGRTGWIQTPEMNDTYVKNKVKYLDDLTDDEVYDLFE